MSLRDQASGPGGNGLGDVVWQPCRLVQALLRGQLVPWVQFSGVEAAAPGVLARYWRWPCYRAWPAGVAGAAAGTGAATAVGVRWLPAGLSA
jgi:hypothetical protein